ncbi:antiterminator LoaP [Bacillus cereus]|uniref:antiterminator LoaP n=1 Tax=Bacillus cereus group TaxID=86661 RepID=UPI003D01AE97
MNWYALFVENGKEEIVQHFLNLYFDESSFKSIVPKRKIPEKKAGVIKHVFKKMFPGYVLIYTRMDYQVFNIIKKIPRCYNVVNSGCYHSKDAGTYFSQIEKCEMDLILKLTNDTGIIDYSKVYVENTKVNVKSGPLKGMEGIIKKVDKRKNRAKLLINFMGLEKTVDVGIEIISN